MITNYFATSRDPGSKVQQNKAKKSRADRLQSSKFKPEWSKIFPSIYFDEDQQAMYCKDCKAACLTNTFTTGCNTLLKDCIQKHVRSVDHKKAIESKTMRIDWDQGVTTVNKNHEKDIVGAMTNIVWMAKNNQPSSLFTDLNDLLDHHVCGDHYSCFNKKKLYSNKIKTVPIKCIYEMPIDHLIFRGRILH